MNYNIKFNKSCVTFESNTCEQLVSHKDKLFEINNTYKNELANFTGIIGQYERFNTSNANGIQQFINKENILTKNMPSIQQNVKLVHEFKNNEIIKKMQLPSGEIKKTPYILQKSQLFHTGNLSVSLIMELVYSKDNTIYNSVAKIYPINYLADINTRDHKYNITGVNEKKRFNNFMYFYFMREGLIGCWIKNNILLKNVSPTFACTYDTYILKGLPITFEEYTHQTLERKINKKSVLSKRWLNTMSTDKTLWDQVQQTHFGFIEMEKIDFTLDELMKNSNFFDLGTIFEILYSKLVLMFFGNIYMLDDHANNIMVKKTDSVRHYKITRRRNEYNFYIDSQYVVKYIDFERFGEVKNRNLFIDEVDIFIGYWKSHYERHFKNISDKSIVNYMFTNLKDPLKGTVDNFCEFMIRCLPEKYTDASLYTGKIIETYELNLDVDQSTLIKDFVSPFDPATHKNVDIPFRLNLSSAPTSGGTLIYRNKYNKYTNKNKKLF